MFKIIRIFFQSIFSTFNIFYCRVVSVLAYGPTGPGSTPASDIEIFFCQSYGYIWTVMGVNRLGQCGQGQIRQF